MVETWGPQVVLWPVHVRHVTPMHAHTHTHKVHVTPMSYPCHTHVTPMHAHTHTHKVHVFRKNRLFLPQLRTDIWYPPPPGSCCTALAGLDLVILLPLLKGWDYRLVLLLLALEELLVDLKHFCHLCRQRVFSCCWWCLDTFHVGPFRRRWYTSFWSSCFSSFSARINGFKDFYDESLRFCGQQFDN